MAERATIARPYAKAAFEYARDAKAFDRWSQGLNKAAAIVADPDVAALTKNPQMTTEQLVSFITEFDGPKPDGQTPDGGLVNFVHVLAENHRLLLLPEIAKHYDELVAEVENTVDVEVISAIELNKAQADKLSQALAKRLQRKVRMQNTVDAALLGGAVVRAGDLVIDGSLKGRLERLSTELTG